MDRRSTDSYIDAIVRKHSLDFRILLEELRREELQAACEALGLDCSGREKAKLVARILGDAPAAPKEPPAKASEKTAESEEPAAAEVRHDGACKSSLRRFVLALAGGLRGRDAATTFTSRLLWI